MPNDQGTPNIIIRIFIRGTQEKSGKQKKRDREKEMERCCIDGFEDVRKGPQSKDNRRPLDARKGKETDSPLESPQGTNPAIP